MKCEIVRCDFCRTYLSTEEQEMGICYNCSDPTIIKEAEERKETGLSGSMEDAQGFPPERTGNVFPKTRTNLPLKTKAP